MFYNFYEVLCYNFKRKTYIKEREIIPGCIFIITFNWYKFTQIPNGISPFLLHLKYLLFCQHASQRALCTVLIVMKTIPFQSWINFLLSFGSLGNHKNTNVYKRKVVGICNWRTRRDHPFWQKHGLRSILIENETVPSDKRSINRINHLKIIHQCPYLHEETYQFNYCRLTVLEELTVQPSCSKVKITVIFEELLKNIINF